MYERFYGLKEKPFNLTPDPEFLFINRDFREALERVIYGILRREGFTVVVGDVGTGKTTLCWALLGKLDQSVRTALVLNPLLNEEDILKAILQDFGVRPRRCIQSLLPGLENTAPARYDPLWMQGLSRKQLIDELNDFLLEGASDDVTNVLLIDEAQNLSLEVLELLRILSNLETPKRKLLQIIFVGQLELEHKLKLPQLRQLNQRITVRYRLRPLSKDDSVRYIYHRIVVAGGNRSVTFTDGALKWIYRFSSGYPRLLNIICDRTLLAGYSERSRTITSSMVRKAVRGLRGSEKPRTTVRLVGSFRWALPVLVFVLTLLVALALFWSSNGILSRWLDYSGGADARSVPAGLMAVEQPAAKPKGVIPAQAAAATFSGESHPPALPDTRQSAVARDTAERTDVGFLLQVHSLVTMQEADVAVTELQRMGYPALQRLITNTDSSRWHVVYVGPFDDLPSARQTADLLREREGLASILRGQAPSEY